MTNKNVTGMVFSHLLGQLKIVGQNIYLVGNESGGFEKSDLDLVTKNQNSQHRLQEEYEE